MRITAHDPAVEPWPIWVLRSNDTVFQPSFAISKAIAVPITPVPIMIASGWVIIWTFIGCLSRIIRRQKPYHCNQQCKNGSSHELIVAKRWLFFQETGRCYWNLTNTRSASPCSSGAWLTEDCWMTFCCTYVCRSPAVIWLSWLVSASPSIPVIRK